MKKEGDFLNEVIAEARLDPNIIGVFLGGLRGKGNTLVTSYSDYDVYIIVNGNLSKYRKKFISNERFEFIIYTLSEFSKVPEEWNRYTYAHVKPLVDKKGVIEKLLASNSRLPKSVLKNYIAGYLDGYINAVYRSLKSWRDGNTLAAKIEAGRSIEFFLKVIFALDSGRVAPYPKYLQWELENFPIHGFSLSSGAILELIEEIVSTGAVSAQQKMLLALEKYSRNKGYSAVFDGWGKKLSWMMEWRM